MSSHAHGAHAAHAMEAPTGFIRKYIFSVDHKVIGIQYFLLALTAVLVGIVLSVLMRLHLVWPNMHLPFVPGDSSKTVPKSQVPPYTVVPYRFPLPSSVKLASDSYPSLPFLLKLCSTFSVQVPLVPGLNSKTVP